MDMVLGKMASVTTNGDTVAEALPVGSFANDRRRDGYIQAMNKLAAEREPGRKVTSRAWTG